MKNKTTQIKQHQKINRKKHKKTTEEWFVSLDKANDTKHITTSKDKQKNNKKTTKECFVSLDKMECYGLK